MHIWEIADQLLLLKRDVETSYFAAQSMQNKIRFNFDQLPAESHQVCVQSILKCTNMADILRNVFSC